MRTILAWTTIVILVGMAVFGWLYMKQEKTGQEKLIQKQTFIFQKLVGHKVTEFESVA